MLDTSAKLLSFHSQLHVLLVEDDLAHAALLQESLNYAGDLQLEVTHVTHLRDAKKQLRWGPGFDVVLLDLSLPDSRGLSSLTGLSKAAQGVPIVVLTASDDEALALQAMRSGAQDYLVKHELVKHELGTGPLVRAIRYAVERGQAEKALRSAYRELEARVAERTHDLLKTNEILEAEITERKEAQERFYKVFRANPAAIAITRRADGLIVDVNDTFTRGYGLSREAIIGRTSIELGIWNDSAERERLIQLLSEHGSVRDFETTGRNSSGEIRNGLLSVEQMEVNGEACLLLTILDITDRKRAEQVLKRSKDELQAEVRIRTEQLANANRSLMAEIAQRQRMEEQLVARVCQQRVVAELGQRALETTDLYTLMDAVVSSVARTLEVDYCKILELLPGGTEVLLRAGIGWKKGYVGNTIMTAGPDSQVGYTLVSNEPVIVDDLPYETRFKGLPLLHEHGVTSGISVIIQGGNGPYGVLGAHTRKQSAFTRDDVAFVQAVANVLAQAIERAQVDDDLRRARDELESKVEERTAALRDANDKLRIELAERKQSEEALRESEMRFRLVTRATNEVIWDYNLVTGIIWWNDALKSLFGYPDEEVGSNFEWWRERIHPDEQEEIVSSFDAVVASGGRYWTEQYRFRRADGTYADIIDRGFGVQDESGAIVRVIGSMMDITERRRAEEDRRAREAAEVANRAKNEFLSRMSHELRTPLNAILGFAQLLELEGVGTSEQRESVGYILKAGQHLLNLINEVLDISRIESGRMTLSLEPLQVLGVLQDGLDLIRPLAAQRGVEVNADFSKKCEQQIMADMHRLKQVVLNLLANAVKYNHKGGSVTLSCEKFEEEWMRISVRDTGPGIPLEKISRLFTPFERLGAEQTGVEGVGLGLALSKRLVEAMGGSIGVESVVGEGSTFWIDLPVAGRAEARTKKAGTGPFLSSDTLDGPHTIVYIEDNLSNLALVERVLAHHPNIALMSAGQGSLGLELVREHHPDLVLADLNLPDMSGEEVLRKLREEPETHALPVVMVTADASPGQVERFLDAGAQAYLTKPIDVRQFLQVLSDVLTAEPQVLPPN